MPRRCPSSARSPPFKRDRAVRPLPRGDPAQGKQALELSGERKQLADVETIVSGDTLIVRPRSRNGFHFGFGRQRENVTIHITAAMLASLRWAAAATSNWTRCGGDQFSVNVERPGRIARQRAPCAS